MAILKAGVALDIVPVPHQAQLQAIQLALEKIFRKFQKGVDIFCEVQYTNRAVRECKRLQDRIACGLVAQLDRVFDYESKGRGFESRRAHQNETLILIPRLAFFHALKSLVP